LAAGLLHIVLLLGGILVGFATIRGSAHHSTLGRLRRRAFLLVPMLVCIVAPAMALPGLDAIKGQTTRTHAGARRHHSIHLNWHAPVNSPKPVVGYNIYRSIDGGKSFRKINTLPVRKTEYDDLMVRHGTTYFYFVKSVGKKGVESGPSNTIQLTVPDKRALVHP
jgi:hypothetical protein